MAKKKNATICIDNMLVRTSPTGWIVQEMMATADTSSTIEKNNYSEPEPESLNWNPRQVLQS
jgi:hypothetical protein